MSLKSVTAHIAKRFSGPCASSALFVSLRTFTANGVSGWLPLTPASPHSHLQGLYTAPMACKLLSALLPVQSQKNISTNPLSASLTLLLVCVFSLSTHYKASGQCTLYGSSSSCSANVNAPSPGNNADHTVKRNCFKQFDFGGDCRTFTLSSVTSTYVRVTGGVTDIVIAEGTLPLTFNTDLYSGSFRVHLYTNPSCGTSSTDITLNVLHVNTGCIKCRERGGTSNVPVNCTAVSNTVSRDSYTNFSNIVNGTTYQFSSSLNTNWLVLTDVNNTVLTSGAGTITWTATFSGTVRVHVSANSSCGEFIADRVISAVATTPPPINQQPANTSVCEGSSTSLSVNETAAKQWQYNNGGTWQNVGSNPAGVTYTNATTNTLGITTTLGTTPPGTYQYRVLVGTGGCQVTSNTATLTVVGATRNAPTGAQCSGTTLNFSAFPATGATYSWSVTAPSGTSAAPTSGTAASFSFTPTNVTGTNQTFTVASSIISGGLTCNRTFSPIVYSAAVPPVLTGSGGSQSICVNSTATVSGMGSSPTAGYSWSENGAGSITAGGTTLTPTYTPAAGDAGNTVTLTLTATVTDGVNSCAPGVSTATYLVNVAPLPTATAGGTAAGCSASGTVTVSGATATNGTIAWTENGAGSITAGGTTLTPTYTAAAGDAGKTVTLFMTVTSNNACAPQTANASYTINVAPLPVAPTLSGQTNP